MSAIVRMRRLPLVGNAGRVQAERRSGRQRGSVSIEFVGTLFMYLIIVLVALQALLAMLALAQANSAARNGARAEALSPGTGVSSAQAAVTAPLRNSGTSAVCTGSRGRNGEITCTVTIKMPMLNLTWMPNWVPQQSVTRSAVQPATEVN